MSKANPSEFREYGSVGRELVTRLFKIYDGYPPKEVSEIVAGHAFAARALVYRSSNQATGWVLGSCPHGSRYWSHRDPS